MKDLLKIFFIYISLCSVCMQASAGTTKSNKVTTESSEAPVVSDSNLAENFRCEKFRDGGISDLKLKMIENCDLTKPFSNSLSLFAGEETYLYCCHKKK